MRLLGFLHSFDRLGISRWSSPARVSHCCQETPKTPYRSIAVSGLSFLAPACSSHLRLQREVMGCGGSARPKTVPSGANGSSPSAHPVVVEAPAAGNGAVAGEDNVIPNEVEQAKKISKEVFMTGMKKVLDMAIDGYPKALRSTLARRNALLRENNGNREQAVEKISEQAAALSEEGKTWLLGLVPFVGFPAQLLYPTWMLMRRVCLLAAVYGLDLSSEGTRALIIQSFAGLRAVPAAEFAIETAVQTVWVAFAGPLAGFLPVGTLVSKVANVEGKVVDAVGHDNFKEKGREVPEAEYMEELDPEPTCNDYIDLAKHGTAVALYSAWRGAKSAAACAQDKDRRSEAVGQAADLSKKAAAKSVEVSKTVGAGAVALAKDQGSQIAGKILDRAKETVSDARSSPSSAA